MAATSSTPLHTVNSAWREERPKHSSGDLHSRLKTRKILGVGETDDGGVHRSKLSQILGHNDQLYVRLPYGLRAWQATLALLYAGLGLWALVHPGHLFNVALQTDASHDFINLSVRLYGGALVSLSILHWSTLHSQDRDGIRITLLSSVVFFIVQFTVSLTSSASQGSPFQWLLGPYLDGALRVSLLAGSGYFYQLLTKDASSWHLLISSWYGTTTTSTTTTTTTTTTAGSTPDSVGTDWAHYSIVRLLCTSLLGALVDWYFFWHLTYRRTYGKKVDEGRKAV